MSQHIYKMGDKVYVLNLPTLTRPIIEPPKPPADDGIKFRLYADMPMITHRPAFLFTNAVDSGPYDRPVKPMGRVHSIALRRRLRDCTTGLHSVDPATAVCEVCRKSKSVIWFERKYGIKKT